MLQLALVVEGVRRTYVLTPGKFHGLERLMMPESWQSSASKPRTRG